MAIWQWAILFWAVLWGFQSIGVWIQMRNYGDLLKNLRQEFESGFIGTGYSPRRLSSGSVVILVVSPKLVVQRALVMRGFTFLAKYEPKSEFEGLTLTSLSAVIPDSRKNASLKAAIEKAIVQIGQLSRTRDKADFSVATPALA